MIFIFFLTYLLSRMVIVMLMKLFVVFGYLIGITRLKEMWEH